MKIKSMNLIVALVFLVVTYSAYATTPVLVQGNPKCADLGYNRSLKNDNPQVGDYSSTITGVGTLQVKVNSNGSVDFQSDPAFVLAVIVKGGPNANVYYYNPASSGDNHLVTPFNGNGNHYGLSHYDICYNVRPTAAHVHVGGRVLSRTDMPINNAVVILTNANGTSIQTNTNPFGYYVFSEVEVGQFYTISVRTKGFTFIPVVFGLVDELTDLNLVADTVE